MRQIERRRGLRATSARNNWAAEPTIVLDYWRRQFAGRPFGAVFAQPRTYAPGRWRVRRSGTRQFDDAPTTAAVLAACVALGVPVAHSASGGPCSADSEEVDAAFLDGGLSGQTGDYFLGSRGVNLSGPRAVLLIALTLGLRVRSAWLESHGLAGVRPTDLVAELRHDLKRLARQRSTEWRPIGWPYRPRLPPSTEV
jgi:hypothetical protein